MTLAHDQIKIGPGRLSLFEFYADSYRHPVEHGSRAHRLQAPYAMCEMTTGFYRYPKALASLAEGLALQPLRDPPLRLLFAPCSIGCEPYSFAALALKMGIFDKNPNVKIDAFDAAAECTDIAKTGLYIRDMFNTLSAAEKDSLVKPEHQTDTPYWRVDDAVRERVRFLPARRIEKHKTPAPYDAVVMLNLLLHLERRDARRTLERAMDMTDGILCVNWASDQDMDMRYTLARRGYYEARYTPLANAPHFFLQRP